MGLNLNIKRIIFSTLQKNKGNDFKERLTDFEIKQIAGRAGRSNENGFVTAFKSHDLKELKKVLKGVNKGSNHKQQESNQIKLSPYIETILSKDK